MTTSELTQQPDTYEPSDDDTLAREREARDVGVALALPLPVAKRILALRWMVVKGKLKS